MTATDQTTDLKATSGDPEHHDRYQYEEIGDELGDVDHEAVGWDLSFGSRINFVAAEDGGFEVSLHLSDDAIANTDVHRAVSRVQVLAFARHLCSLVKGVHDIETHVVQLAETLARLENYIYEKADKIATERVADANERAKAAKDELVYRSNLGVVRAGRRLRYVDLLPRHGRRGRPVLRGGPG